MNEIDRAGDDVAWAVRIAGRVAACLLCVVLIGAVGVGFALGRWWFG